MRWWILIILLILFTVMILPTYIVRSCMSVAESQPLPPEDYKRPEIEIIHESSEPTVYMYDAGSKKLVAVPLEQYLTGVIAAEMPASFEIEALKAQAVAARTLAVQKIRQFGGTGCNTHSQADVCSSPFHCQAWISDQQQKKNWGKDYEGNRQKILRAVEETRGEIMTYQGEPIEVFFYSTSNGKTEDVHEVFSKPLPYYSVVESKGEEDAPKYKGQVTLSNANFINIFKKKYPNCKLSSDRLKDQIKIKSYTDSGRVREVVVGGITVRGTDFRNMYKLNSADFMFKFGQDSVTIYTTGYGHGVGMSQIGANSMAEEGQKYDEILKHYYLNVDIVQYSTLN